MEPFINTLNQIRDILRKEGITGMDSIIHCVVFILIKSLTKDNCKKLDIDNKYSFDEIIKIKEDQEFYEIIYNKRINCLIGQIKIKMKFIIDFKITSVVNLRNILLKMKDIDINILSIKYDIVGIIYECHMKTGTSNGMRDLGQYFTNRSVINYMIKMCDPKIKNDGVIETILDPTMGTGGFLTMAIKYLNNKNNHIDWKINKNNIYGFDIDENIRSLSLINSFFETNILFEKTLVKQNSLENDFLIDDKTFIDKVDIILANEPFGIKGLKYADCCEKVKKLNIKGTKAEPLFLQLMMQSLNENGRCAVIVPDGVLFNDANLHKDTRKHLCKNFNLLKVISLEDGLFLNTGVKSSILFFVNNGKTKELDFCKIKLLNNEIVEELLIKVDIKEIEKNNYSLFVNKYTIAEEIKIIGVEYKKLEDICDILPKSKRPASFGKDEGKYKFFTSSLITKYCDEIDYVDTCLIIGTGGNANIKISNNFSCSADNFIVKNKDNKILIHYLYYWFINNINKLENYFHGSTIKHLSKSDLENIKIPIPQLSLQQQIVKSLDVIYDIIEGNQKLIINYEQLKKSIIWSNTLNVKNKKLGDIVENIKTGKNKPSDNKSGSKYPYYGTGGITGYTDEYLVDGSYILTARNGMIGQTIFVNGKSYPSDHMFIIKDTYENIKYIYSILKYIINFEKYAVGTTIKGISKENLISVLIPIPSKEIQEYIVKECDYYDNLIDILKKENNRLYNNNVIEIVLKSVSIEN